MNKEGKGRHSHRRAAGAISDDGLLCAREEGADVPDLKWGFQRMLLCCRCAGVGCRVAVAAVLAAGLQGTGAAGPGGGQVLLLPLPSAAAAGSAARLVILLDVADLELLKLIQYLLLIRLQPVDVVLLILLFC